MRCSWYGKMIFTVMKRNTGEAVRVAPSREQDARRTKSTMSPEDRQKMIQWLLDSPEKEVLTIQKIAMEPQPYAKIRTSIECTQCYELVMESRIRVHAGKYVCIPCVEILERQPRSGS